MAQIKAALVGCLVIMGFLAVGCHGPKPIAVASPGKLDNLPQFGFGTGTIEPLSDTGALPPEILRLAQEKPGELFSRGLAYYRQNVRDYRCRLLRQELLGGKLLPQQEIDAWVIDQPFAVYLDWLRNPQKAKKALYLEGENQGKVLVKPVLIGFLTPGGLPQNPAGKEAREASRRSITEFGLGKMLERIVKAVLTGQLSAGGGFEDRFAGLARVAGRETLIIERFRASGPKLEPEVAANFRFFLDSATLLPAAVTEFSADGAVLGHYIFRDLQINPGLTPELLKQKFRQ